MSVVAKWSRHRKLVIAWSILSFMFLAIAAVLITVAEVWRMQEQTTVMGKHTLRTLVIGKLDLTTATVLGVFIIISFIIGLVGFYQSAGPEKKGNTLGLVVFNWSLICTTVFTVIVGSIIWFFTLRERRDFMRIWLQQPAATQAFLQDTLSCCGYWNATDIGLFTQNTGFCSAITNVTAVPGCVTPITAFADYFLNNVFTTIYGFTAVEASLFLITCCLIISRHEEDRFRRIDSKVGGGFV